MKEFSRCVMHQRREVDLCSTDEEGVKTHNHGGADGIVQDLAEKEVDGDCHDDKKVL